MKAVEVEPAYVRLAVSPGQTGSFEVKLKTGQVSEKVSVEAVDYTLNRKGDAVIGVLDNQPASCRKWCQLKPANLIVNKNIDQTLKVPFRLPPGTPGGEYYMALNVSSGLPIMVQQGALRTEVKVSTVVLVILRVPGATFQHKGDILNPEVKVENAFPSFKATFKNTGNVSMTSVIGVAIRKPDRTVMDVFLIKSEGSQVRDGQAFTMPGGLRDFAGMGNRKLPAGPYVAEMTTMYGPKQTRVTKRLEFKVKKSDIKDESPIVDVIAQDGFKMEVSPGAISYTTFVFQNQGFNPITFDISSSYKHLKFLPGQLTLQPGKRAKVRGRVSVPAFENPRRDIPVKIAMKGGTEKDQRDLTFKIYAPGTMPEEKVVKPKPAKPDKPDEKNKTGEQKDKALATEAAAQVKRNEEVKSELKANSGENKPASE